LTSVYVEDLGRTIAAGCQVFTIATEAHAADNTVVNQMMDKVDIEHPLHLWVEDSIPISTFFLL
jgi:Na+/H+ antiporter NhaA